MSIPDVKPINFSEAFHIYRNIVCKKTLSGRFKRRIKKNLI